MKSFMIALVVVCVTATAGTLVYLNRQKTPPAPTPAVESSSGPTEQTPPEKMMAPKPEPPRTVSGNPSETTPVAVANSASGNGKPDAVSTAHSLACDTLVSAQTSFSDRQALLKKLKKAGELDAAIAELKQRAADNPNDPEIPAVLGAAYLNKFPVQDPNEAGILGMEADQSFNAALKLDPANWSAQFLKAESLSYWPSELNKGQEVVQRFSNLIDQQETMTPQPQFAQTYVLLGDEYQKLGQPDYAEQTWKLGAAKFPGNATLQKRINHPPGQ
jgi:hypothetical protein